MVLVVPVAETLRVQVHPSFSTSARHAQRAHFALDLRAIIPRREAANVGGCTEIKAVLALGLEARIVDKVRLALTIWLVVYHR